jgi:hypothetical protein
MRWGRHSRSAPNTLGWSSTSSPASGLLVTATEADTIYGNAEKRHVDYGRATYQPSGDSAPRRSGSRSGIVVIHLDGRGKRGSPESAKGMKNFTADESSDTRSCKRKKSVYPLKSLNGATKFP